MPVIGDEVGLTVDRILLATDFSPAAETATRYAEALAKRFSSMLMLAHVIDLAVASRSEAIVGRPIDEMRHAAGENFVRLIDELSATGIRSTSHTMEDRNPAAAVLRLAKRLHADLIVTGTSARQGLNKVILGSCAEGIIRHAECPVLGVGPKAKPAPNGSACFRTIIFATDFSSDAMEEAAVAFAFARDNMAKLYLCHIVEDGEVTAADNLEIRTKTEADLRRLIPDIAYEWVDSECVVEDGHVADGILNLANRVGADLIVTGAKRSTFLSTHLISGVVGQVLAHALCPVMTVHMRASEPQD